MAKITQYPAKTVPSNNDEFVLHDTAAGSTKKMTRGDLIGGAPLPANSVDLQAINGGTTAGVLTTNASGLVSAAVGSFVEIGRASSVSATNSLSISVSGTYKFFKIVAGGTTGSSASSIALRVNNKSGSSDYGRNVFNNANGTISGLTDTSDALALCASPSNSVPWVITGEIVDHGGDWLPGNFQASSSPNSRWGGAWLRNRGGAAVSSFTIQSASSNGLVNSTFILYGAN